MTRLPVAVATTLLASLACGTAPPRVVPPAPRARVEPTPALPPVAPPAVLFDDAGVEEVFMDRERIAKLTATFPEIDATIARAQLDLKLPGLAVGIIVDGELAHVATAGYRDLASKQPVTADTVFRIGSVTKTLTAAAILKLRDDGKLSLDDAAAKYLPELHHVRYPTKDSPLITLRHLLTHASGLPRQPRRSDERIAGNQPLTREELRAALEDVPLAFAPGSGSSYSNLAFTLLGLVVEQAAKMPYRAYLQKSFFAPLGMKSAGWERARLPSDHVAWPYETKSDGSLSRVEEEEQLGKADASGGLYLSVKDLSRWVGFNLAAYPPRSATDPGPLARASVREMHGANGALRVAAAKPFSTPDSWLAEPWAAGSALGWDATALCDLQPLVEKAGFVERYQTFAGLFPNEGVGLVVLTNTGHVDALKRRAFFDVLKLLKQSGGLVRRVRIARNTPVLDAAIAKLIGLMETWDEAKYLAMLTTRHKKNVPMAVEKAELAGYAAFHGRCKNPEIVRFDTSEIARYRLECERGKLEMELTLEAGLIAGFVGISTEVSAEPQTLAIAEAELAKRNAQAPHRKVHGRCKLGALENRDGNRWYRFALSCERGPESILALRLSASNAAEAEAFAIEPRAGGACAALAPRREAAKARGTDARAP